MASEPIDHGAIEQQYSTTIEDFLGAWENRLSASPQHRPTAKALLALYSELGLLPDDRDLSLRCCCPHSDQCWADARPPQDERNSGIAVPWIGRDYFKARVVVLGINFDNFGGLAGHYHVCEDHIRSMEAGKPGKNGEIFSRGAMQALRIVLASLGADEIQNDSDSVADEDLAALWEECAYVQGIKCSPGTERSYPTPAMFANCPEFILKKELEILQPSVVILFGRDHLRDVVRPWSVPEDGYGFEEGPHYLERNRAVIAGKSVTLLSLNHPSGQNRNNFRGSLERLTNSLRESPLH